LIKNGTNEKKEGYLKESLTLCKQEVDVTLCKLPQFELQFFPENPRIYSLIKPDEAEPSQEEIQERLLKMDHVKKLVQSIRANGGLTDPLIVRDGDYVVLEGNSRLAAYRKLAKEDPIKWGFVKCKLLPRDIDESLVFALLGEYHIIGRKDWAPYEQAGYLYRRNKNQGVSAEQMASEMGLTKSRVSFLISVYSFMIEKKDYDIDHWSYYEEYLKSHKIRKARDNHPQLDEIIPSMIKTAKIEKAVDVRKKVSKVFSSGPKLINKFIENQDLETCYEIAISRGVECVWLQRLKKFRGQNATQSALEEMLESTSENNEIRKKLSYEWKKIAEFGQYAEKKLKETY
jgi:hypothetical protein